MKHSPHPTPHTSPHYLSQYLIFLFLLLTVLLIPGASFNTLLSMYINDGSLCTDATGAYHQAAATLSGMHGWVSRRVWRGEGGGG